VVTVTRAKVVEAVRDAAAREAWAEALVASYVWGQGTTSYGPHRLKEILAQPSVPDTLAEAARAVQAHDAVAAYRLLDGAIISLGPAFFTKFLYFVDLALASQARTGPLALILDRRVSRVLRAHATRVGLDAGLQSAADVAAWIWSDIGWTPHRYDVYLLWMTAATEQLASSCLGWPACHADVLELALFSGAWEPSSGEDTTGTM
jgi:hypothetical protein